MRLLSCASFPGRHRCSPAVLSFRFASRRQEGPCISLYARVAPRQIGSRDQIGRRLLAKASIAKVGRGAGAASLSALMTGAEFRRRDAQRHGASSRVGRIPTTRHEVSLGVRVASTLDTRRVCSCWTGLPCRKWGVDTTRHRERVTGASGTQCAHRLAASPS